MIEVIINFTAKIKKKIKSQKNHQGYVKTNKSWSNKKQNYKKKTITESTTKLYSKEELLKIFNKTRVAPSNYYNNIVKHNLVCFSKLKLNPENSNLFHQNQDENNYFINSEDENENEMKQTSKNLQNIKKGI